MRSFVTSMVVGLVVTTMAAMSSAGEPLARPRIELAPPVKISGFHRPGGWQPAYTGGSIPIVVDVQNTGYTNANVVVKLDIGEAVLEKTVSILARTAKDVTFDDTEGLASSCKPKSYAITLAVPGAADQVRTGTVQPSCTFKSTLGESWNLMSPDRVEAEKTGNAYLSRPVLVSGPTCSAGPTVKVHMINRSVYASPSIIVQAKDADATPQVRAQTSAAFPIAAGEDKELLLTPVSGVSGEVPERIRLSIQDWTKSLRGRTSDGGISVVTTRSCQLAFDLR